MAFDYRCFYCFCRACDRLISQMQLTEQQANTLTAELIEIYASEKDRFSTPQFARELHARIKQITGQLDPYSEIKAQSNRQVLAMYADLKQKVSEATDPFEMALRLAIAGNIIDYAVHDEYNLPETIAHVVQSDFAINHAARLKAEIAKANKVLYLGDNNGEVVFDKLFIETINHPNLIYAVRGDAVINDVTITDAQSVGMDELVNVISNGYDAPSTLPDLCSSQFKAHFESADLIISKGQGNLEGLLNDKSHNIAFLLMVKCPVIAEKLQVAKGDFVVKMN
ncbi:ARMT1-like domain-containing protein [Mangrovibacterium marinum]|uniref:damage-control phosphatase ARMT1 family protein n=1 Tax=Mangrovibacterium marinum TaxID=1639118 RepID=UPI002A18C70B|nr:ARMT1-like domain-containing protein [Mangrovibacterium marinum]